MPNLVPTVVIGLLMLGAAPVWPYSRGWGWAPFAIVAVGFGTLVLFQLSVAPEA